VAAASELMGGAEPYHSHTKVLLKEPRAGGAWEWHQDFGYYYNEGLLQPEKVVGRSPPAPPAGHLPGRPLAARTQCS
jgi:hypothetical protein